ncbi:MAG: hypothetical protein EOL87_17910, partial [Spartobacteria bacterium]|nr:hypothetical protein [Spartobacteria bacterium]
MSEWVLVESSVFASRFKRYQKNHGNETKAVLNNLDTFFNALQAGGKTSQIQAGFIHREPQGVIAIDQKGAEGKGDVPSIVKSKYYEISITYYLYALSVGWVPLPSS